MVATTEEKVFWCKDCESVQHKEGNCVWCKEPTDLIGFVSSFE